MRIQNTKIFKFVELLLFFVGLPLLLYFDLIPVHKAVPLLAVFFLFFFLILRDKSFDRKKFGFNHFQDWGPILFRFFIFAVITTVLIRIISPEYLFILPREAPFLWLLILIFYPLWSALPQEFIFRTWFFHRYRELFGSDYVFILINALLFSFSHIIFNNWLAIVLTFIGSIIFAMTYRRSQSLMTVFVEHLLYGNYIFTVGFGQYFYAPTG